MREFEKRNPNLKVFNAVMHLDEATPHLHINFVPVCYGQKQGLSTRVSMKRAIQQMGFTASGKKETEAILWGSSERAKLTEILNNHNIVRQVVGAFHDHKSVEEYRHFAASALISAGLDVTTVSGALGHTNSGTTLNVYSHMFQNAQARVADVMDRAFSFLPAKDSTSKT